MNYFNNHDFYNFLEGRREIVKLTNKGTYNYSLIQRLRFNMAVSLMYGVRSLVIFCMKVLCNERIKVNNKIMDKLNDRKR